MDLRFSLLWLTPRRGSIYIALFCSPNHFVAPPLPIGRVPLPPPSGRVHKWLLFVGRVHKCPPRYYYS
uniref:Uncharacterized protein n=1 Tax=Picea glauca TaxID=3330 RepID=A0A101M489_PICGL|nr:hypothetical protein ABT39_MTgene527 [Picea glauca]